MARGSFLLLGRKARGMVLLVRMACDRLLLLEKLLVVWCLLLACCSFSLLGRTAFGRVFAAWKNGLCYCCCNRSNQQAIKPPLGRNSQRRCSQRLAISPCLLATCYLGLAIANSSATTTTATIYYYQLRSTLQCPLLSATYYITPQPLTIIATTTTTTTTTTPPPTTYYFLPPTDTGILATTFCYCHCY